MKQERYRTRVMSHAIAMIVVIVAQLVSAVVSLDAQVAVGVKRFNSYGGGPFDTVNLGNLNVHFAIPIVHKAGRGVPLAYDLTYDSAIWAPVKVNNVLTWQPASNWGWSVPYSGSAGIITYQSTGGQCTTPEFVNGQWVNEVTGGWQNMTNWQYIDAKGATHAFPNVQWSDSGGSCGTVSNNSYPGTQANDNSGLMLYAGSCSSPGPQGNSVCIQAPDGTQYFPPINPTMGTPQPYRAGPDTNGNQITSAVTSSPSMTITDTLGQVALTISGTNPVVYAYTSPTGASVSYKVAYSAYNVKTQFGCNGVSEYTAAGSVSLVSSIALPDDTQTHPDRYTFTYEPTQGSSGYVTGRLSSVTLPTGGSITYAYPITTGGNNGINCADGTPPATNIANTNFSLQRTLNPGGLWNYQHSVDTTITGHSVTAITTPPDPVNGGSPPAGDVTIIDFMQDSGSNSTFSFYETQRVVAQGNVSWGNWCSAVLRTNCLLAETNTCWNGSSLTSPANCQTTAVASPIKERTVFNYLGNGSMSEKDTKYDTGGKGLVLETDSYDYGSAGVGNKLQIVKTNYGSYNSSGTCTALGNGIISKPCSVIVLDGSGTNTFAETTYTYDQGTPTPTNSPQHVSVAGSRGNLTTLTTYTSSSTSLSATRTYYDTGTPNVVTDVNGAQTTYVYGTGSCGNAFPTQINEPLGLSRNMTYDASCAGAVTTKVTDENQNPTTSIYGDPDFWRLTTVTDQMTNQTTISYFGQTVAEASLQNFNGGNSASDMRTTLDGFGRRTLTQRLQSPTIATYDTVETDYDNIGRPYRTTMPFSAAAGGTSSTAPSTTKTYDALGRLLMTQDGGGGTVSYQYLNNDILQTVSGTQTGTQSFMKQFEYDALGRLTSVCEMTQISGAGTCRQSNSVSGFWTEYTYDPVGHLLTVIQNAQGSPTQARTFTYDWLGRMMSESNPETGHNGVNGLTTYTYDSASNPCGWGSFTSPGNLIQKTDALGNSVCFQYDLLHRVTAAGYTAQNNPGYCKRFGYDNAQGVLGSRPAGVSVSDGLGRMVEAETDTCAWPITQSSIISDEWFSYDKRGELTDVYEATAHSGGYYHSTASYWPTGSLNMLGLPTFSSLPTWYYGYSGTSGPGLDGEGRVTRVAATTGPDPVPYNGVTYSSSSTTNSLGALTSVTFGSGDSDSFSYDSNTGRLLTYSFGVNGQTDFGTLSWSSNGMLSQLSINDQIPGTSDTQNCSYSYDGVRRLSSVSCGGVWSQTFSYDAFGNIQKSGSSSFLPGYTFANGAITNQFFSLPGASPQYDGNGNLLTDNLNTYTWDVYGEMASVVSPSATVNGTYDALGRIVEKNQSGTYTEFIYAPTGKEIATANGQGLVRAFISLPGGAKAIYTSSGISYYRHSDWLGSSRLTSTQARTPYSGVAYAPFGEQYAVSGSADPSFTGADQDIVTDLYDFPARQYSPSQGRWVSPDPLGRGAVNLTNPQSWNRYAYVLNNPLLLTDPLGLCGGPDKSDGNGGVIGDPPCDGAGPGGGGGAKSPEQPPVREAGGGGGDPSCVSVGVCQQDLEDALQLLLTNPDCSNLIDGGNGVAASTLEANLYNGANATGINSTDAGQSLIAMNPVLATIGVGFLPGAASGENAQTDTSGSIPYPITLGFESLYGLNNYVTPNPNYPLGIPVPNEVQGTMLILHEVGHAAYAAGYGSGIQPDNVTADPYFPAISGQNQDAVATECLGIGATGDFGGNQGPMDPPPTDVPAARPTRHQF